PPWRTLFPYTTLFRSVGTKNNAPILMNLFMRKSVGFFYELMFTRPVFQTPDMQAQHDILVEAARLVDAGVLNTTLTERFGPLTRSEEHTSELQSRENL